MTDKLIQKRMTLEAISPIFIGAGKEAVLSPCTDFVQEGNELICLDERKLQSLLMSRPELVDRFVEHVRQEGMLEDFLTYHCNSSVASLAKQRIPVDGEVRRKHIQRFLETQGAPFVPGSTIKGAMATAVLWDWLLNNESGLQTLQHIQGYVGKGDRNSMKSCKVTDRCFNRRLDNTFSLEDRNDAETPAELPTYHAFRFLQISDARPFSPEALQVSQVERVRIVPLPEEKSGKDETSIPQWRQTVRSGASTLFSLSLLHSEQKNGFQFVKHQSVKQLFLIINSFSKASCERELAMLKHRHPASPSDVSRLISFYETLLNNFPRPQANEAILRIGGGKTWFDNSIGLAIGQLHSKKPGRESESLLGDYLKTVLNIDIADDCFPQTRSVLLKDGTPYQPLGWVRLKLLPN
ncbi:MAG: type III-A CRISPR-associated RAMP protein Csm5 [Chlorobiaceae bacterium]|nr:type III-A CRISPR-associated RAMP protein Csm5 [Chlorobiaceae bacterium]